MAWRGIDTRQSGDRVVFRFSLKDAGGNDVAAGTTTLALYEVQGDGTLKSYDFADGTFKTTALTTPSLALTHQTGNNGTTPTGIWTGVLSTLTGLTRGNIYVAKVTNANASPPSQERQFQYGDAEGDFTVNASGQVVLSAVGADQVLVAGKSLPQALRYIGAAVAGALPSGAGSGTEKFQDFAGVVAVTVSADTAGNRTSVLYA